MRIEERPLDTVTPYAGNPVARWEAYTGGKAVRCSL